MPTVALTVLAIALVLTTVAVVVMSQVWAERRIIAFMQGRLGPNRVGPAGLLQSLADVVKLLMKEIIIPTQADRIPFQLAPLMVLVPSLLIWVVLPWGPGLMVTDLNIGVLFILATGAIPTIGILAAGWASGNKYSLLGGMRVAAQLISYEIPMAIIVLVPVLLAGTMSLQGIIDAQSDIWFVLALPVGPIALFLFLVAGIAEVNRSPFDLAEAESEIIGGFHTEYSGMAFALFFLAEYANAFAVSAIASTLFLGGWLGPILPPFVWFFLKAYLVFFVLIWIRGTLPRLRYDQFMASAWKVALPIALVTVGLTAVQITLHAIPGGAGIQ
ncbi:MAG: NADH-quinone oxidoreductase subunit NuoH [Chloroflexi bacterium]|nr:NADH-quinone oxidoreductase subunit NuoH [Chloroflexota bacterium]